MASNSAWLVRGYVGLVGDRLDSRHAGYRSAHDRSTGWQGCRGHRRGVARRGHRQRQSGGDVVCARGRAACVCADQVAARAEETVDMIVAEGGTASVFECDVSHRDELPAPGRGGRRALRHDSTSCRTTSAFRRTRASRRSPRRRGTRSWRVNVRSMVLTAQAVVPHMPATAAARSSTSRRSPACARTRRARRPTRPARRR